jgi:CheY-like chemotaxis protein
MAFARREALQPRAIEPDVLMRGMEELLARTLGPEIRLEMRGRRGGWRALSDPHQLETALLNLAINARDAMPAGGTLTITTADRQMTADDLHGTDDPEPGDYVEIAVTDTGTGMAPEIMSHVFEPFFTTKPVGYGTGLGLSQLYGFIRQSHGFVRLESALGQGTTVRLYLPRYAGMEAAASDPIAVPAASAGHATLSPSDSRVLVVEDEEDVRAFVVDALRGLGCRVQEATDGVAAMRVLESSTRFDLLVTDVGLPGVNGRQLADAARDLRPGMKVLLITGYAGTALERIEIAHDMRVIRKPFGLDKLTDTVGVMLREPAPAP